MHVASCVAVLYTVCLSMCCSEDSYAFERVEIFGPAVYCFLLTNFFVLQMEFFRHLIRFTILFALPLIVFVQL